MRQTTLLAALTGSLVALSGPAALARAVNDGDFCNYARPGATQPTSAGVESNGNQAFVYTGSGSTGNPGTTAAGACVNVVSSGNFQGGTVEGGTGAPGTYLVYDGDARNLGPTAGYAGVSNYEDGSPDPTPCNGNDNDGDPTSTNGGGCFGLKPTNTNVPLPGTVPTPICDTGNEQWNTTARDGCFIP